ncbi:MAG: polysaccharide deacetylase family protein [Candidatus Omnitrophica bacterium]|nr:polysaccharide deacetylase family protein [Candidatus Omnitrophota bacterium]
MKRNAPSVPILTYHGLVEENSAGNGLYTLTQAQFEAQMAYLARGNFHSISLRELVNWLTGKPLPEKPIVITFDDGLSSDFSIAFPILKRHGFTTTFFVNPGTLNTEDHLTTDELRRLNGEGMEVGSHGFDHIFLTRLDDQKLHDQLTRSKKRLEEILKKEVPFFSIPRGRYNHRVLEAVKGVGYRAACTSDIGVNRQDADPFRLKRWTIKRPYTLDDFISIVEGRTKGHLVFEYLVKQSAYRLLGHTLYERVRGKAVKEK